VDSWWNAIRPHRAPVVENSCNLPWYAKDLTCTLYCVVVFRSMKSSRWGSSPEVVRKLMSISVLNFFIFFISICKFIRAFLKFIKTIHPPPWAIVDRAYRRRPRQQHVQPPWPTAVRLPATVESRVWVPRQLTVVRLGGSGCYRGHGGRTYPPRRTAAAAPT
jgi:hypothetical protein